MNDEFLSVIYLLLVLALIFPGFIYANKNKKIFNLREYVNDKLVELNVKVDHINRDTYREKKNFFSYRRSSKLKQNDYGRCISAISMI